MWFGRYLFVCAIIVSHVKAQRGASCRTPNGDWARCSSIYDCQRLLSAVRTRDTVQVRFLRESQCGYDSAPLVCCGTSNNYAPAQTQTPAGRMVGGTRNAQFRRSSALPNRAACGFQETDRIYHGNETSLDEFPWMALFQYRNDSGTTKWACAGTLISSRYVLTAAHCVTGLSRRSGKLVNIRLGEHNTNSDIDCTSPINCNERPVDIPVESTVVHDRYDNNNQNRYNDIALVRLSREVKYSNFIRPICLPEPNEAASTNENVIVAGWGATERLTRSPVKLKLQLPIADKEQCSRTFTTAGITLGESQICAGGQEGRDSCTGDSGGPLMATTKNDSSQWYLEGVVSFGARCGSAGWPGVYTKVESFIEWIHGAVRD